MIWLIISGLSTYTQINSRFNMPLQHSQQIGHSLQIDQIIIGKKKIPHEIIAMNDKQRIASLITVLDIEIIAKLVNIFKDLTTNTLVAILHLNNSSKEFYLQRIRSD